MFSCILISSYRISYNRFNVQQSSRSSFNKSFGNLSFIEFKSCENLQFFYKSQSCEVRCYLHFTYRLYFKLNIFSCLYTLSAMIRNIIKSLFSQIETSMFIKWTSLATLNYLHDWTCSLSRQCHRVNSCDKSISWCYFNHVQFLYDRNIDA